MRKSSRSEKWKEGKLRSHLNSSQSLSLALRLSISRWRTMDAIKKKMQAMKVEKDNAMDRADVCEQASKDAKV